jgi:hypothetical protein
MDAVAKGYLKNMYFGISQDAAGTQLLEVSKAIHRARGAGGWHSWPQAGSAVQWLAHHTPPSLACW